MVRVVFFSCQRLFGGGRNYLRRKLRGNQEMAPKKRTLASAAPPTPKAPKRETENGENERRAEENGPRDPGLWTWGRFSSPTVLTTKRGTNGWLKRKLTNGGKRRPKKIILAWADNIFRENAPPARLLAPVYGEFGLFGPK